jgi:putative DNA primase/helicase
MWTGIPTLVGISEMPILRADGSLLATAGYDITTGLYVEGRFPELQLPDAVTREDAIQAATRLLEPFSEFPLVEKALDQAVLLAYMITLALRPQLTTAPLFCVSATTPGTGKGLLVEAANLLVRGRDAATMPPIQGNGGEEETRKRITALIIQGLASANLDNWTRPIGGEAMNALMTATEWSDRVLSVSKIITLPNRMTIAATGNNLSVRGDMVRRSLLILLDAGVEHPERRKFKEVDLPGRVLADRGQLLAALFTILKAYQQAGSPGSNENLLGRFEPWCAAVCGPIRWLGYPDPLESQERLREQDPEADKLVLFLSAWWDLFGFEWKTAGDIILEADQYETGATRKTQREAFKSALTEVAGDGRSGISGRLVGWFLSRNAGRIADGHKLERKPRDTKSKASLQYRVRRLADVEESS